MGYTRAFSLIAMVRMGMLVSATTACRKIDNGYHGINNNLNIVMPADQRHIVECMVYAVCESNNLETFAESMHNMVTCMVTPEEGWQHESAIYLCAILMALLEAFPQSDEAYIKITLARIDTILNGLASHLEGQEPGLGQKFRSLMDDHIFRTVRFKEALLEAATYGHVDVVDRMLAGIVKIYGSGAYPILYQIFADSENPNQHHTMLSKAILRETGDSAAMICCVVDHLKTARNLCSNNTRDLRSISCLLNQSVPCASTQYHTALHLAVLKQKPSVIQCLIELGADPNIPDASGDMPLHLAVLTRNIDIIERLIGHKANPNILNRLGATPLHLAVLGRKFNVIECLLINQKTDPNIPNSSGDTPIHLAIKMNNPAMAQYLLERGANFSIHRVLTSVVNLMEGLLYSQTKSSIPNSETKLSIPIDTIREINKLLKELLDSWNLTMHDTGMMHDNKKNVLFLKDYLNPALVRCQLHFGPKHDKKCTQTIVDWLTLCEYVLIHCKQVTFDAVRTYHSINSCDSGSTWDGRRSWDSGIYNSAKTYDSERVCDSAMTAETKSSTDQILYERQHPYASPLLAS